MLTTLEFNREGELLLYRIDEASLKNHEAREAKLREFVERTLKAGEPFTDPSFMPETESIYDKDEGYAEC